MNARILLLMICSFFLSSLNVVAGENQSPVSVLSLQMDASSKHQPILSLSVCTSLSLSMAASGNTDFFDNDNDSSNDFGFGSGCLDDLNDDEDGESVLDRIINKAELPPGDMETRLSGASSTGTARGGSGFSNNGNAKKRKHFKEQMFSIEDSFDFRTEMCHFRVMLFAMSQKVDALQKNNSDLYQKVDVLERENLELEGRLSSFRELRSSVKGKPIEFKPLLVDRLRIAEGNIVRTAQFCDQLLQGYKALKKNQGLIRNDELGLMRDRDKASRSHNILFTNQKNEAAELAKLKMQIKRVKNYGFTTRTMLQLWQNSEETEDQEGESEEEEQEGAVVKKLKKDDQLQLQASGGSSLIRLC